MVKRRKGKGKWVQHLKKLSAHHQKMAVEVAAGARIKWLAEKWGYSEGHMGRIVGSPVFKAEVERLQAGAVMDVLSIHDDLKRAAKKAVEVMDTELNMPVKKREVRQRRLRLDAAFGVYDRAYPRVEQGQHVHLHKHAHEVRGMSDEDLFSVAMSVGEEEVEE